MLTDKTTVDGARYDMGARNAVADLIEAAAKKIGASVYWQKPRHDEHKAVLSQDDYEIEVEACDPKLGARIESDDGSHTWDYPTAESLAVALRRRFRTGKERETKDEIERQAKRAADAAEVAARTEARADLARAFGETLIEAATYVDARTGPRDKLTGKYPPPVVCVSVFCDKIKGRELSVAEAARLIQALTSAGYDLVAINDEVDKRNTGGGKSG